MATRRSRILEKLRRGDCVILPHLWAVPHWKIVDMMGFASFDSVWIENEHSDFNNSELSQMILAARAHDMDSIVRTAPTGYTSIIKILEAGATGIMVPHCKNAEDARLITRDARFAPIGLRGMGGSIDTQYGMVELSEYMKHANQETLVIVMIEDKSAVEDVDEIAATEGIDVLFVGPGDLSQDYGIPGQIHHELINKAMEDTAEACNKHGKWWGTPAFDENQLVQLVNKGAKFIEYGSDQSVLMEGFLSIKKTLRKLGV